MTCVTGSASTHSIGSAGVSSYSKTNYIQGYDYSRHRHGEAFDGHIVVERFQDVPGDKRVINASILVWMQTRKLLLPYVDHLQDRAIGRFALNLLRRRNADVAENQKT